MTSYPITRGLARLLALPLLLACATTASAAVDESELLPIEQAFALSAEAIGPDRVAFTWKIADGYYLYRHRMAVTVDDPSVLLGPLELPAGEPKVDEFFGETETYRGEVTAVQTGIAGATGTVEFVVGYQGCADVGICYPPHRQRIAVELPAAGDGFPAASATTAVDNPLARSLGLGAEKPAPVVGPAGPTVEGEVESLPLPPEEAFGFEAIAVAADELLLRFTPAPGYYLYRDRSSFALTDGQGVGLGEAQWPPGTAHVDEHFGEVVVYFDQVEVPMPLARSTQPAQTIALQATFQGCQTDGICYPPMTREVRIDLPAASQAQLATSQPAAGATGVPPNAMSTVGGTAAGSGIGVLLALGLALLGGLILNLMPCVLPVLSLKAVSLAQSTTDPSQSHRHALWYSAGVLVSFAAIGGLAIALRAAGAALGWGFQLQQPVVVAALAYVMVAIGLALSGVYHFGAGFAGVGQSLTQKSGPAGDFFTGVLAVVVASPCTAPFMGSALAFAFAASPVVALGVFLMLGLGLALPFLLIGFVPALARLLPRPGAWMETFKQLMAFPMYLTAAWLIWVLARQRGADAVGLALAGATVLALGLWALERARQRGIGTKAFAAVALLIALLPLAGIGRLPPARDARTDDGAIAFSVERLDELRASGQPVFVNMTADWCVTCKVNETRVLGSDGFRDALRAANAAYVVGDWTDVDPEITAFLDAHGAVGVPFYIVYPADGGEGRILPTVLTMGAVRDALTEAGR